MSTKLRPEVPYDCKKCNGKLVDTRTRKKHYEEEKQFQSSMKKGKEKEASSSIHASTSGNRSRSDSVDSSHSSRDRYDDDVIMNDSDHARSDEEFLSPKPVSRRKRRRYDQFHKTQDNIIIPGEEPEQHSDSSGDEEGSLTDDDDHDDSDFDELSSDDDELFAAPRSNLNYDPNEEKFVDVNDPWILLWIFKYQERFRLSDVAINSLIGFFSLVLKDINTTRFKEFPSTAYMARKLLDITKRSKTFVACTDCNKLYNPTEIMPKSDDNSANSGFKCTHIEFPNHPMEKYRQQCGSELLLKVPVNNGFNWRPKMIYPLPCLKTQLSIMYKRPGFEDLLKKWTNRDNISGIMSDIYDGEIWKTFPSSLNTPNAARFFEPETADRHLGIMINLDWFQPFKSAVYSCGAIYSVICNLPRDIRFKKENMLTLALLPGPNEIKLDKINHYLAPIIDELLELWDGFNLPTAGKNVRLAVICCSNDILAARKLCGHASALAGCHRCYKRANREEGRKSNFSEFEDMNDWFIMKDPVEHRRNAMIWKYQLTKEDRNQHVKRTLVQWSEMIRLPYLDPIRFLVVDPMHNLFLKIAHWIVKMLWIDNDKITKAHLELMEKRAKQIKVPADVGRIPYKIATGEGFLVTQLTNGRRLS